MQIPKFLENKNYNIPVEINPALLNLGTETAFDFGIEVTKVEKSGKFEQIYKFHVGDTGPKTPQPIIDTTIQALKDKQTKYAPFLGYDCVRENIANHISSTRGVEINKNNVMLIPGGKPAIELAIQALLGPGDFAVVQNPGYPIYESLVKFYTNNNYIAWQARYSEEKKKLEFRLEDLEEILSNNNKIKLLIINTPQNPTGMILPEEMLKQIADLAEKYNFMILFDDIYDQIVFNGKKHYSLLSAPGMLDRVINLNGLSKDYAMTGWRAGFVVAPEWVIEIFGRLAINKWTCVTRFVQIATGVIFGDVEVDGFKYKSVKDLIEPEIKANAVEYEKKGKFLVEALQLLEPYLVPNEVEGAFYEYPNITKILDLDYVKNNLNIKNDREFTYWLLRENGIANLAGMDFGEGGRGHIRFSYAEDRDMHIIPGIKHFIKVILDLIEKSKQELPIKLEDVDSKVEEIKNKYF